MCCFASGSGFWFSTLFRPFSIKAFELFGFPFGPYTFYFQAFHLNTAVVFALGISSLSAYALLLAGWSSESRYPFFGALRSAAQTISYELALGLSLVGVLLLFNSLDFLEIIRFQEGPLSFSFLGKEITLSFLPNWGIFLSTFRSYHIFYNSSCRMQPSPF